MSWKLFKRSLVILAVIGILSLVGFGLYYNTWKPWSVWERNKATVERQVRAAEGEVAEASALATAQAEAGLVPTWTPTPAPAAQDPSVAASQPTPEPAPAGIRGGPQVVEVQSGQPVTSTVKVTTEEAKTLTGVDVQRLATEPSAFVWRAQGVATTTAICPLGWICTWAVVGDITVVHSGVGQTAEITAGTWRQMIFYPEGVCVIFQKEKAFGASEVPSFQVRYQNVDGAPENCDS